MTTTLASPQPLPGSFARLAVGGPAALPPRAGYSPARVPEPQLRSPSRLHGIALPLPRETGGERLARLALLIGAAFAIAHAFGVLAKFNANFDAINAWAGRLLL